jgi:GDP-L-fucose synthase
LPEAINANNAYCGQFVYKNLTIEANLIHGTQRAGVQRRFFLDCSCIYLRDCTQPIKEEYLLTGPLEPTNEPCAIANTTGINLCESYRCNCGPLYVSAISINGDDPNDNNGRNDLQSSHLLQVMTKMNCPSTSSVGGHATWAVSRI